MRTITRLPVLLGIIICFAQVPESIAFAYMAHVRPPVAMHAAWVIGHVCGVFGGRPGMVSGASATCALVVAPLGKTSPEAIPTAVVLAGLLQMAIGYLKGGRLVRMLPHPVVLGFVNGSAQISAHG